MEERLVGSVGEGLKEVGERRKSRDQDFVDDEDGVREPLERSWMRRLAARGRVEGLGGRSAGLMGSKETAGRVRSSRTSLMVNAALNFPRVSLNRSQGYEVGCQTCIGPLLPITLTLLTRLFESASSA